MKTNALSFEILADQIIKIYPASNDVAPDHGWRAIVKTKRNAKLIEDLARKKGDLPFVVILKVEVAIPADAVPSHAFDRRHFNCGIRVWFASVVSYKIVTWRDVQVTDFHRRNDITRGFSSRGNFSINRGPAAGIIEPQSLF